MEKIKTVLTVGLAFVLLAILGMPGYVEENSAMKNISQQECLANEGYGDMDRNHCCAGKLLQLILVGQPELRQMILRPELRQFAQRVTATYHISSLDRAAVAGYIQHRLTHVGGTGSEFTAEAIDVVHYHTHGIPRLVNKLCDFAMVYAATEERRIVDAAIIEEVLDDGVFLPAIPSAGEAAE